MEISRLAGLTQMSGLLVLEDGMFNPVSMFRRFMIFLSSVCPGRQLANDTVSLSIHWFRSFTSKLESSNKGLVIHSHGIGRLQYPNKEGRPRK